VKARVTLTVALAMLAFAMVTSGANAAIPGNVWLQRHFLNIAHQGGEDEVPSNTMYAFKTAIREAHADMLETDVHLTGDGVLVTSHDDTYTRTGCTHALCPGPNDAAGPQRPGSQIRDMTLAQLRQIDMGYWFRPATYSHDYSLPDSAFPYRGIATGAKAPPSGYSAEDFKVPTVKELLDTFPNTPINLEIKMPKSYDPVHPYTAGCGNGDGSGGPSELCDDLDGTVPIEQALAALLTTPPYSQRDDIIVVSFAQEPMVQFALDAPNVARGPSLPSLSGYAFANQPLDPDPVAFQVPPVYGGVKAPQLLLGQPFFAHQAGYAVHVWTNGDQDETTTRFKEMVDIGADGVMTANPRRMDTFLCSYGVPHPNGLSRCPAAAPKKAKCKKKHKRGKGKVAGESKKKKKKRKCKKKKKKKKKKKGKR
jgi:glycerophosphoryl diester phosphodiesterase